MSFIERIFPFKSSRRKNDSPPARLAGSNPAREGEGNRDGQQAENLAAAFLESQGMHVLERNFRVRGGEIDLIALDGETLVFVEVRLRRNRHYGGAGASITRSKQLRLILAAEHWIAAHGDQGAGRRACRFDCILLADLDQQHLEWVRNAFSTDFA